MLKILQVMLQQYLNWELPDIQASFRKGRGTRDQAANICWIIKKAREFQKNIYFCFIDYAKAFDCVDHNKLWKILKEMGLPGHLTCLLRNLYADQEATFRPGHETMDRFQVQKGVRQGCILSPCLFNLYAEYIMWNPGLDEAQARIKIARRNINNLRYTDDTTLMAESKEELRSLLMKVKEDSETAGLKLNIQKTKIVTSGPITSWHISGETVETVRDFVFLGSKITADGDCGHEIKRRLLLWRKAMTNLDSILKSIDITLLTKVHLVKAMVFLVVMNGCESWIIGKLVLKTWCFWTVVLEKTLECPLVCKEIQPVHPKGNQSWIFIGRTDAEAPILWPPDVKSWLIWKDPDVGKDWRREERGTTEDEMVGYYHRLNGHEFEQALGVGDGQGGWRAAVHRVAKSQLQLRDWIELTDSHTFEYLSTVGIKKVNTFATLSTWAVPKEP